MLGWILLNAFGSFHTLPKNHEVLINTRTRQFRSLSENPFKRRETVLVLNHIIYSVSLSKSVLVNRGRKLQYNSEKDDDWLSHLFRMNDWNRMAALSKNDTPHNLYRFAKTSPPEEIKEKFQVWTCQTNLSSKF